MKFINILVITAAASVAATAVSCSKKNEFVGSWTAAAPTSIVREIPSAATATSLMSIDFLEPENGEEGGSVFISSIIDITQPVRPEAATIDVPYEVSVAATASIGGKWAYEKGEDDDLLLSFDMSSLKVNVDPSGVSFSQNMLTGAQQPVLDSLTTATIARWKDVITAAVQNNLSRMTHLEDLELSDKGQMLRMEVGEQHLTFRRNGLPAE